MTRATAAAAGRPVLHLHIGLPKTATTYLQTGFFPDLPGIRFVPTPRSTKFADADDAQMDHRTMSCALKRASQIWDDIGDELFEDMLGPRADVMADPRDVLISDEGIGRIGSRPQLLQAHILAIAERAAHWGFERVTVVCVFRRQDRWLASHYAQISDRNPSASQKDFEQAAANLVSPHHSGYTIGMLLDYAALHEALVGSVGADNLLMLPFERLAEDKEAFGRELLDFLGVETAGRQRQGAAADGNVRSQGGQTWAIRPYAGGLRLRPYRIVKRLSLPRTVSLRRLSGRGRTFSLTPEISHTILDAYHASNERLQDALGATLGPYGYF